MAEGRKGICTRGPSPRDKRAKASADPGPRVVKVRPGAPAPCRSLKMRTRYRTEATSRLPEHKDTFGRLLPRPSMRQSFLLPTLILLGSFEVSAQELSKLPGVRSVHRRSGGVSTTSRRSPGVPRRYSSERPAEASIGRTTAAPHGPPFSTAMARRRRSATSRSRRVTRTSCGWARERRTTGRAPRGATASIGPSTAGTRGSTWGSRTRRASAASSSIRATPPPCSWRPSVTSGGQTRNAVSIERRTPARRGKRSSPATTSPGRSMSPWTRMAARSTSQRTNGMRQADIGFRRRRSGERALSVPRRRGFTWEKRFEWPAKGRSSGRIGLAIAPSQPSTVYAIVEARRHRRGLSLGRPRRHLASRSTARSIRAPCITRRCASIRSIPDKVWVLGT